MSLVSRFLLAAALSLSFAAPTAAETFAEAFPGFIPQLPAEIQADTGAMVLRHGTVSLDGGVAELIGWAQEPRYDKEARKLYWAKHMQFEGSTTGTLNYNIRVLGRRGVLVANFITDIDQLSAVNAVAPKVMSIVNFSQGHRYADFVPGVDTVAAVGIGGLIAGKIAAKAGLLVLVLAFLKKGIVLVLLPAAWLWTKFKSRLLVGAMTPKTPKGGMGQTKADARHA